MRLERLSQCARSAEQSPPPTNEQLLDTHTPAINIPISLKLQLLATESLS